MKKFLTITFILLLFIPIFCLAQNSIENVVNEIAGIVKPIAVAAAVLMIVIGGFQWMTSAGDPGKIAAAKEKIYSAILGLLIIALASTIAYLVGGK